MFGPAARSNDTGSHAETVFTCAEPLQPDGVGCELVHYASALKLAERPCHHLEVDGSPLDEGAAPDAQLGWTAGGQPLFAARVPGEWSSNADEWFLYLQIGTAPWVDVSSRHGPGVANSKVGQAPPHACSRPGCRDHPRPTRAVGAERTRPCRPAP